MVLVIDKKMSFDDPFFKNDVRNNYMIHIRFQQRNARKFITTVEGMPDDLDVKKILRYIRKVYHTNGCIVDDDHGSPIIQLQGDKRKDVYEAFTQWNIAPKENITVHGG